MTIANGVSARAAAVRHAQRATGQASAVASMIATGRSFPDVAQQLLAARGSLDSLLLRIVELELEECLAVSKERDQIEGVLHVALGRTARGHWAARVGGRRTMSATSCRNVLVGGDHVSSRRDPIMRSTRQVED